MNAGAYGGEMADVTESCEYIGENLQLRQMNVEDMKLSYRHSVFCEYEKEQAVAVITPVITRVRLRLEKGVQSRIKAKMDEISAARREKQPLEYPSAGSTFKRPQGHFAAKLIEDCGLKGKTVGGAQVSMKHSGFVINAGGATFDDVIKLIELIQNEVYAESGIMLEREVLVWQ